MRLAVISDIHANFVALSAVVADLRLCGADGVVCLGDISFRGPRPAECIDLLRSLEPLAVVRGNQEDALDDPDWAPRSAKEEMDLALLHWHRSVVSAEAHEWLTHLPTTASLTVEGVRLDLFHAAPWSLNEATFPWAPAEALGRLCLQEDARVVLFGHTHLPFVRSAAGRLIVNTGSVGMPFDGDHRAAYAIVDIDHGSVGAQVRRVPYDLDAACGPMPYAHVFEAVIRSASYAGLQVALAAI